MLMQTIIKNDELKFDAEVAMNHVEEDYQMNGHDQVYSLCNFLVHAIHIL